MPLETLDGKIFAAQFSELSRLEAALKDTQAGSPEQETARAAYQVQAQNLIDYLQTHKPALVITVTTEQPEPYVNKVSMRQVAVSSPGFEQLENGSRMLANALTMLHLITPRDDYDETFAEIDVKNGTLARSTASMQPSHSPFFGGADTTYFVPAEQNGVLLAVQDAKTLVTDGMTVNNAQTLGLNFMCEVTYIGPHPNFVKTRVDPRQRAPVPPGAREGHYLQAPTPAFRIDRRVTVELFTSLH